jgi:hypothetical protein
MKMSNNNTNDEQVMMRVNGVFHSYVSDITTAMGNCLEIGMQRLAFMSNDAIINWINEALLLAEETMDWPGFKNIALKKRITTYRKGLEAVKDKDRETLMNFYTNIALGCSGNSLLSGFGFTETVNRGGKIKAKGKNNFYNPEKKSIY